MGGHTLGHEHGRQLCDALLTELSSLHPGLVRDELTVSCGIHHPPNNRFAYVYHSRKKPDVQTYFRSDPELPLNTLPESVPVERREKFNGNWSHEFSFFLRLSDVHKARDVALLLSAVSFPLAIRKKPKSHKTRVRPKECPAEEVLANMPFPEGSVHRILVNRYERDPRAREACIKEYGTTCCLCDFDFVAAYGEAMAGFIHVHHIKPLCVVGENYKVDPVTDLRPVCPNCHAVLHRREPPYSLDDVRAFLGQKGGASLKGATSSAAADTTLP